MLFKKTLLSIGAFSGSVLLAAQGTTAVKDNAKRPNVLFILSDDHTSQAWGVYGGILNDYIKNENIKRLAQEGCVLDNVFCTNSISVPSRASILTGAYSHRNRVYTLSDGLDPEEDNIAKRMQQGGYQTVLFGKWHLKKKPTGFDKFCVFHDQGEYFDPIMKTASNWVDDDKGKQGEVMKGFSTDIVTDMTMDWIRNRDKDKPFMMFCHFKATHEPWDCPKRFEHLYDDVEFPEPPNLMEFSPEKSGRTFEGQQLENMAFRWITATKDTAWWCKYPGLPFSIEGLDKETARKKTYQKLIKDYLRCGAAIDENIGRLLDMLKQEGIDENTIVVYVSDQGYFLGEHGFFDKRMMYEESLRMPFVIRYPKEIPAGSRNKDIILNVDFASLLADYANIKAPEKSQGRSFRDNLKGQTPNDWRQSMYYRYWTQQAIRPAHLGIRSQDYKLMFLYGDPLETRGSEKQSSKPAWEFYDLRNDPYEDKNQYSNPLYQSIIKKMRKELLDIKDKVYDKDNAKMAEIMKANFSLTTQ